MNEASLFPAEQVPIPLSVLLACVERELRWRRLVYPKRVEKGTMTQAKMEREIELMEAVLLWLRDGPTAVRAVLTGIVAMGGKTLLAQSLGPDDCDRAYQMGANAAFEQAAELARRALWLLDERQAG
jgi:hypothetical protein